MTDENKTESTTEVVEAPKPAEITAPKKRGPRQKKITSDVVAKAADANAAPTVRRGRKRKEMTAEATAQPQAVAKTKTKGTAKTAGKPRARKQSVEAPVAVLDEIADLIQLEEENARLRKALGEKLRAENAELRKRLGLG